MEPLVFYLFWAFTLGFPTYGVVKAYKHYSRRKARGKRLQREANVDAVKDLLSCF